MGVARFSSRNIPSNRRTARFSEILNSVLNLELTGLDGAPLEVDTAMRLLPGGLVVARSDLSPLSMNRTARHAADGNDNFILSVPICGEALYRVGGREIMCGPGEAFFFPGNEPSLIANRRMSRLSLSIPRKLLEPALRTPGSAARRQLNNAPALALLASYANALTSEQVDPSPQFETLAATHIRDLVALSLGPDGFDLEGQARPSVRAARLRAIKEHVRLALHRHDLSLDGIARRHGISPRYVQSLFRDEETTFRDFVLGERLLLVHAQLSNPAFAARSISDIAYSCGFGDLSYFNHAFRRRFGMTPGDVRRAHRA
jgi:AraC-like DNA-binding protein